MKNTKKYAGIKTEYDKAGNKKIIVRFKYLSVNYGRKNFTKLFGCKSEKQADDKLKEIKVDISRGNNPFLEAPVTLDDLWEIWLESKKKKDWTYNTYTIYTYFYNAHIKESIGWKKISKINYLDLDEILKKLETKEAGTKNKLKRLLRPIFQDAKKKGFIQHNVIDEIETEKEFLHRKKIQNITSTTSLNILRKIYKAIPLYKTMRKEQELEIKNLFYMIILTAHRIGELRKLTVEHLDFKNNKIVATPNITKSKEFYHYPIPKECLEYFKTIEKGFLFPTIGYKSEYEMFQRLIKLTDIKFYGNETISPHSSRRLLMDTMIRECNIDSRLADYCLSHKPHGVIKHYLEYKYEDAEKSFQKFWGAIREDNLDEEEFTLDDIPKEMLEMLILNKKMKK